MYNFNYWPDHGMLDWALLDARVWHETGHQEAARFLGVEASLVTSLDEEQPRIAHPDPEVQYELDALTFLIDAMAVEIDIAAYSHGDQYPTPSMDVEVDLNMLSNHVAHRLKTGTGCLRGCGDPPDLIEDDAWVNTMSDRVLDEWEGIAFRANRLWNWHLSKSWAQGCKYPERRHICTSFRDMGALKTQMLAIFDQHPEGLTASELSEALARADRKRGAK